MYNTNYKLKKAQINKNKTSAKTSLESWLKTSTGRTEWCIQKPFAKHSQVISYLDHYTYRATITNERIKAVDKDRVPFSYRGRKDSNKIKETTLSGTEFIRRFLAHILPRYFTRIRHFGFLANRGCEKNIESLRKIFGLRSQAKEQIESTEELMLKIAKINVTRCLNCGVERLVTDYAIARSGAARGRPTPGLLYLK